jgi:N-acetylmuramoyl-L-alanine amidase
MKKVYLRPSDQKDNVGVNGYGNEKENMFRVAYAVKARLNVLTNQITVYMSNEGMTMQQGVYDANDKDVDLYLSIHSNALTGASQIKASGTEAFYGYLSPNDSLGRVLARKLVENVGKVMGTRYAKPDNVLYDKGLYDNRAVIAPSCLVELFYHDNPQDVTNFKARFNSVVEQIVKSIMETLKIPYPENDEVQMQDPNYKQIIDYVSNYQESWYRFLTKISNDDEEYPEGKQLPTLIERIWSHKKA